VIRAIVAGAVVGALAACVPDVGPPLAGSCSDAHSDPAHAVSFRSQIRPVIARPMAGCNCHLPTAAGSTTAIQLSGLNLSTLSNLRAGGLHSGAQVIVAGQPCSSILYQKVDEAPPFGSRMPLGGPPYLSETEIALIHDWIAEGAADN
jgi:hypothetical protein